MPLPRLKVEVLVDTLVHAQTLRASLAAQLLAHPVAAQDALVAVQDEMAGPVLSVDLRWNALGDRDALRTWVQDQLANQPLVKTWVHTALVSWHDCTHSDASIRDCTQTGYAEWRQ